MRLSGALHLYRVRLAARRTQECFALIGIASGVALLFAAQVAGASLAGSVSQLSRGIEGNASLQLRARGPQGMPATLLAKVREIAGVRVAAPLLEVDAEAIGSRASRPVELVGADASLAKLGGRLLRHTELAPFGGIAAVVLPVSLSDAIGITKFGEEVTFDLAGHSVEVPLYAQLPAKRIGELAESPVAILPLSTAQAMSGLGGRLSRILIEPYPGRRSRVAAALHWLAAGRLNVEPAGYDATLFATAAAASERSTELFAVIGALVGFLFAFNAMLLAAPQRRALLASLRQDGYTLAVAIALLLLDGIALGALACCCGLLLGEELSMHLLRSDSTFLSLAFTLGPQRTVSWQTLGLALGGGMLAAVMGVLASVQWASGPDAVGRLGRRGAAHVAWRRGARRSRPRMAGGRPALLGAPVLGLATVILLRAPQASMPGIALLLAALLLELPLLLSVTLALARRLAAARPGVVVHLAAVELLDTRPRALAIAATGAIAVFGGVAIEGAHGDLLAGLQRAAHEANAFADAWVSPFGSYDVLHTAAFQPGAQHRLSRLPGVRAVRQYRSGLLDYGPRRVLVVAPPKDAEPLLPAAELLGADVAQATRRVRSGGWIVISKAIATEHGLRIGESVLLPSPKPARFRIAALSTNLGWAPGAIVMNASDYAQAWGSSAIAAYAVTLAPGFPRRRAVREIDRALGPRSGLRAETAAQHEREQRTLDRQALARLSEIAALIPIAAVLAVAAAMGAMIWQRRPRLAKLKLDGLAQKELWQLILTESMLLLGVGCFIGAVFGVYGQQLADRALASTVNFPVIDSLALLPALSGIALVTAAAVAVLAIPGYLAAAVPAALAFVD